MPWPPRIVLNGCCFVLKRCVKFWLLLCISTLSVAASTDADSDGVADTADRCKATPVNAVVNQQGCHFDQAGALFTVRFEAGSAWVSAEQTLLLRQIAKQLAEIIHHFPGVQVAIRGFNGGEADRSRAENLSLLRAKAVMRQLKLSRVPAAAMSVVGMGQAAVAAEAEQAQRVDVLVLDWRPDNGGD